MSVIPAQNVFVPKEKLLEIHIDDENKDETQMLADFIEEGFEHNHYQDYNISLKVFLSEKMMKNFKNETLERIISPLNFFQDECKDLEVLSKIKDKTKITQLALNLMDQKFDSTEKLSQNLSNIFSLPLLLFDFSFEIRNEVLLKIINEKFTQFNPIVESLSFQARFNIEEGIDQNAKFLGDTLDSLKNIKYFKIHLHDINPNINKLQQNYFKLFFRNFNQLKNVETLEVILDTINLNDETLNELLEIKKIPKLQKLSLKFVNVSKLNEMQSLSNFLETLHTTNLKEFAIEFCSIRSIEQGYLNFLNKTQTNEKIYTLEIGFRDCDFFNDDLITVSAFIAKFPKIIKLELAICQTAMDNAYHLNFCKIFELENVIKLEYLRLILYFNKITDEFGKAAFKILQNITSLKYLFLDMHQSWNSSQYLNDALHVNVTEMLDKLVNLKSILFNFDGNEIKRGGSGYIQITKKVDEMREKYKLIENFKLLEREEVDLGTNTPNRKCHLAYEFFFKEFEFQKNLYQKKFNYFSMNLVNFEIILNNCELKTGDYTMQNIDQAMIFHKIKNKFKILKLTVQNPIYNPSLEESIGLRSTLISDASKFSENKICYSFFLVSNEECQFVKPPPIKIDDEIKELDEIKHLKSKEPNKINKLLSDMLSGTNNFISLIAKTPLFVQLLCENEDILVNFSVNLFEKMMNNFNPDDAKSVTLFLNKIFRETLNANMKSDIPPFILSKSNYCKYLTCESFAFLAFYAKKVSKIDINPNGLTELQIIVHKQKVENLTSLHLEENQYFSTRSCKESLLELIDNKWKLIKLRSPDFFYDNDIFIFEMQKQAKKMKNSFTIQNSINEFYSNIREAIKDFELDSLDDFYSDFILGLFSYLPNLKDINVSNLNLGDKFCEGFNTFVASERKKKGEYRFINLEILNNMRITNVGLKFLYVSYQIMRNYFKQRSCETLPKLKVFAVFTAKKKAKVFYSSPIKLFSKSNKEKQEKLSKIVKKTKKIRRKKGALNQINFIKKFGNAAQSSDKVIVEIEKTATNENEKTIEEDRNTINEEDFEEIEVTDEEETAIETEKMQKLLENEEKLKVLKQEQEQKLLEDKVNMELSKKNLDETSNGTIILNEGLGSFIAHYIRGLTKPKRFFCYNCDSEVCKECHKLHHKFNDCQPDFVICEKCKEIHHKSLVDCKIENQDQIICRGFRQILQIKKKNLASNRFWRRRKGKSKGTNKCAFMLENCISKSFICGLSIYFYALEGAKKCIMGVRKQFERCCVGWKLNEKGEKIQKQSQCLEFLNCFFGDPDTIDDEVKEFKFNKNVIDLNHSLGSKRLVMFYSLNFIIYYALVAFIPAYFRGLKTVLWESHYIYAGYAGMIFFFEAYLTYFIIKTVNLGKGNKILKDFSLANYLLPLILSQIKKYDFYTDVVFIISNINENRYHIAIISGTFLAITTFMNFLMIISLLANLWNFRFDKIFCKKRKEKVQSASRSNSLVAVNQNQDIFATFMTVKKIDNEASNQNINLFCKISALLELECIGNCLDKFSTKNAWYFPYFGGYYIPQQIISSMLKFCFEDIPSFVIQVFVLSYYYDLQDKEISNFIPIIITTIVSLVASVSTVLTAKASILKSEELKLLESEKFKKDDEIEVVELKNALIENNEMAKDSLDMDEKKNLIKEL